MRFDFSSLIPIAYPDKASQFQQAFDAAEIGDYRTAYALWKGLAEQGIASAQYNLGGIYYLREDYRQAVKWHTLAAEQGLAQAQYSLGEMYFAGQGVKQDYKQAIKWYTLAAEQGGMI